VGVHGGKYHLFYQYVPDRPDWAADCRWGHAVSRDLLTWEHRPVALAPGDGDDGIWTGSIVEDADGAHLFYTSVSEPDLGLGRIRVATAVDDDWDVWVKGDVVVVPPLHLDLVAFRDPVVRREADGWRLLVGAGTRAGEALVLTWTSADLRAWAYDGVAASRSSAQTEPVWTGAMWECPQVFEVDGQWLLVFSVWDDDVLHHAAYALGAWAGGRFTATTWARLSFGGSYYAPSFVRDRESRPCLIFWMRGVRDADEGWSGCLSVPYLLSVRGGRLVAEPHPDVAAARVADPDPGSPDLAGSAADAVWTPPPGGGRTDVLAGGTLSASVVVGDGAVRLERAGLETWTMPWAGGPVRLLVDGPVLEVSSADGLLGGAIVPADTLRPGRGDWSSWRLEPAGADGS
jgi:beta-fructofuranosidase